MPFVHPRCISLCPSRNDDEAGTHDEERHYDEKERYDEETPHRKAFALQTFPPSVDEAP